MTMRLKFEDAAGDGGFTEVAQKPLIPEVGSNISVNRMRVSRVSLPSIDGYKRLGERDGRTERLADMSLEALLYYALIGKDDRQ